VSGDDAVTGPGPGLGWYQGRRVLVTGGASFIGSHLVDFMVRRGAAVTVADDLSSGRVENLGELADECRVMVGDLRDAGFAGRAVAGQEVMFHLAASHGGRGYIDTHPVECCNNMMLDHVVLQSAASAGVGRFVLASSACVYPTNLQDGAVGRVLLREDQCGFDEPGQVFPDGEYGWAKLTGELQLRAFQRQYGLDAMACRIFTAYGERENESHAVVALIAKALAGLDPYPVWGDGTQTRNFTYVGDVVLGLALAGAGASGFDVVNVGSPVHTCISELIEVIFAATGFWPGSVDWQLDRPVGVKSRAADCAKSDRLWGWHPSTPLSEGIARTVAWYAKSVSRERLDALDAHLMTR
jgi:nucleoside-diphosphate-sugar epimerase